MAENRYIDTRGHCTEPVPYTQAVIDGLADGGGLYVAQRIPHLELDEILGLAKLPYRERAAYIYRAFKTDLDDAVIDRIMAGTYGANFDDEDICPITSLDENTHILELWHGPTSAFKDMALQCLPRCFSAAVKKQQEEGNLDHDFLILVATSGDTGKAALEGFKNQDHVSIGVMYPDGGVSDIQYKQMATQTGDNVRVWGVRGNFDDCQAGAKAVFDDEEFANELQENYRIALSSANSINWGRLMPQIVYYVSSYAQLVEDGKVEPGSPIDVCVPTGNFGNILAAWYAKQMGTPIERLLCASNENRVLTDFINTGVYDISHRKFVLTPSPSMDILVSSNLERQLFELTGRDAAAISRWMDDLKTKKRFEIDAETFEKLHADFSSDSVSSVDCLRTIKEVYDRYHYLLDPHSAVAFKTAENLRGSNPILIASTAHWAKFGANVYRALHGLSPDDALPTDIAALSGCALNEEVEAETGCGPIPTGLAELDSLPIRFTQVIDGNTTAIKDAVREMLSE
ncbi:MAG: threonine synthase [Eggerthellaceae bacterium]